MAVVCKVQGKGEMNKYGAPEHAVEAIQNYVQNRFSPGGFITGFFQTI